MNDTMIVKVGDGVHDSLDELGSVTFSEVLLLTDAVKQFASEAQVRYEIN